MVGRKSFSPENNVRLSAHFGYTIYERNIPYKNAQEDV